MANPGYPMQPQQPMGMPPQMAQNAPRPVRRGTSKAVPVIMSAGLAVGVFCGLLFGLGTGDENAIAAPATDPKTETPKTADVAEPFQPKTPTVDRPSTGSAAVAQTGSGSAAPDAGSGSAIPTVAPAAKTAKLIVDIKPDAAAEAAKITIDGKEVTATSDIEMGDAAKKKVTVVIKSTGFKDITHSGDVEAGADTRFDLEMIKKPRGGGAGLPRPETGSIKKKDPPPKKDGRIDI